MNVQIQKDTKGLDSLAASLCSSLNDDPVFRFALGPPTSDTTQRLKQLFLSDLNYSVSRGTEQAVVYVSEDKKCIAQWYYDGFWTMSVYDKWRALLATVQCFRWRTLTFLRISYALAASHPSEPHMYLWMLGIARNVNDDGLGSKVITVVTEKCDREGIPAYTQCTNPSNMPFYKKHGFEPMYEIKGLPDDCPPIVAMWRKPVTSLTTGK